MKKILNLNFISRRRRKKINFLEILWENQSKLRILCLISEKESISSKINDRNFDERKRERANCLLSCCFNNKSLKKMPIGFWCYCSVVEKCFYVFHFAEHTASLKYINDKHRNSRHISQRHKLSRNFYGYLLNFLQRNRIFPFS